uniref:Uncharacterized protein n=1 Tax=Panagrellus redivivus TaxID=6233 RepID=A0A7E4V6B4_PANRE
MESIPFHQSSPLRVRTIQNNGNRRRLLLLLFESKSNSKKGDGKTKQTEERIGLIVLTVFGYGQWERDVKKKKRRSTRMWNTDEKDDVNPRVDRGPAGHILQVIGWNCIEKWEFLRGHRAILKIIPGPLGRKYPVEWDGRP